MMSLVSYYNCHYKGIKHLSACFNIWREYYYIYYLRLKYLIHQNLKWNSKRICFSLSLSFSLSQNNSTRWLLNGNIDNLYIYILFTSVYFIQQNFFIRYFSAWSNCVVVPIFKEVETNDPYNYRGISLMSCFANCLLLFWTIDLFSGL